MAANWFRRELYQGLTGSDVTLVQRKLKTRGSGVYDSETEAKVRGIQKLHGLDVTGEVDEATSELIGDSIRVGMVPDWYERPLVRGMRGDDVRGMRHYLGLLSGDEFTWHCEEALRRFQSVNHLPVTGVMNKECAIALGDDVVWSFA